VFVAYKSIPIKKAKPALDCFSPLLVICFLLVFFFIAGLLLHFECASNGELNASVRETGLLIPSLMPTPPVNCNRQRRLAGNCGSGRLSGGRPVTGEGQMTLYGQIGNSRRDRQIAQKTFF
jgi:hypothetical protein